MNTWDGSAAPLSVDHRVIHFDLAGFGLTGADPTSNYTNARSIALLLALLDRVSLQRVTQISNSTRGRFAWMFAAVHRLQRSILTAITIACVIKDLAPSAINMITGWVIFMQYRESMNQ